MDAVIHRCNSAACVAPKWGISRVLVLPALGYRVNNIRQDSVSTIMSPLNISFIITVYSGTNRSRNNLPYNRQLLNTPDLRH